MRRDEENGVYKPICGIRNDSAGKRLNASLPSGQHHVSLRTRSDSHLASRAASIIHIGDELIAQYEIKGRHAIRCIRTIKSKSNHQDISLLKSHHFITN
jgi:hypothetical protein